MPDTLPPFIHAERPVVLRGVNLGSWLNIEDFMLGLAGTDWQIRKEMERCLGHAAAEAFFRAYAECFVTEADIRRIRELGFNSVRVPFNWRYFETDEEPFRYHASAFRALDRLFDWCDAAGLLVLLDFHAAPGGQNTTPPSDCVTGYAHLWSVRHFQDRVVSLWEALAARYRDRPSLLGYDLLNEPQIEQHAELDAAEQGARMNALYARLVDALRAVDPEAWLVIEPPVREDGSIAALDPGLFRDERTAVSYHQYPLYENAIGHGAPLPEAGDAEGMRAALERATAPERAFAARVGRPLLLGEFGLSRRWDPAHSLAALKAQVAVAEACGVHWQIWTWKDVWRMGLVTPAPEMPWVQFVRGADLVGREKAVLESLDRFCGEAAGACGGADAVPPRLLEAARADALRGARRMLLHDQVRRLAGRTTEEIAALAEAFRLDNCRLDEVYHRVLFPTRS